MLTTVFKPGESAVRWLERLPQYQVYFEEANWTSLFHHDGKRSSVSQYHVSPLHSTCCSWNTIPHYSWQSVHSDKCSKELKSYVGKKKKIMSVYYYAWWKKNAVSECGTKPVCISGIYLLCFYWQVLWLKFASVTVYYPVHTRGCENLE